MSTEEFVGWQLISVVAVYCLIVWLWELCHKGEKK